MYFFGNFRITFHVIKFYKNLNLYFTLVVVLNSSVLFINIFQYDLNYEFDIVMRYKFVRYFYFIFFFTHKNVGVLTNFMGIIGFRLKRTFPFSAKSKKKKKKRLIRVVHNSFPLELISCESCMVHLRNYIYVYSFIFNTYRGYASIYGITFIVILMIDNIFILDL